MQIHFRLLTLAALAIAALASVAAAQARKAPPVVGRWDITIKGPEGPYPSWVDIQLSGRTTLVGYFVSSGGSVRPISQVHFRAGRVSFDLPVQWERGRYGLRFEGRLTGNRLMGRHRTSEGRWLSWSAVRAPSLRRSREPEWGDEIELFNGRSLAGWRVRNQREPNGWIVRDGLLVNAKPGNDLITVRKFQDFKLSAEFKYPKRSNSWIYLRGRYEAQIEDSYGRAPEAHQMGGIYGFLAPRVNSAKPAGEWQTYDITLVGRYVTLVLNGEEVIDRQEIPGITGGALDSDEGQPGPIYLQGDHGPISFRKLTLTPAR